MQLMAWTRDVLTFWFSTLTPQDWYNGDTAMDTRIREQFGETHAQIARAADEDLLADADTSLAAIIVLDQFSRNLGRKTAAAFAHDAKALRIAKAAIAKGHHTDLPPERHNFLCMPFMHSESLADQDESVALFAGTVSESYAKSHRDIIAQFGRYPYRNKALGRESTPEELTYLKTAETYGQ